MDDNVINNATSYSYTYKCLEESTHRFYCMVSNDYMTVKSRVATIKITSCVPVYTYSGSATSLVRETNRYNWYFKLKTTGTLNFTSLGSATGKGLDIYLVGGGGSGGSRSSSSTNYGAGGAGGNNKTVNDYMSVELTKNYTATIGAGGAALTGEGTGKSGGSSSIFGYSASGGAGGAKEGSGAAGTSHSASAFGDSQYGTYGAGGNSGATGAAGGANTGKGGSGGKGGASGAGGSGIIVIRNAR